MTLEPKDFEFVDKKVVCLLLEWREDNEINECIDPKLTVVYKDCRQKRLVSTLVLSTYEERMALNNQLLRYLVENDHTREPYYLDYLRFLVRGTTFCEDSETWLLRSMNTQRQVSISWLSYVL